MKLHKTTIAQLEAMATALAGLRGHFCNNTR